MADEGDLRTIGGWCHVQYTTDLPLRQRIALDALRAKGILPAQ